MPSHRPRAAIALLAAAVTLALPPLPAQQPAAVVVSGVVHDSMARAPLRGAEVQLLAEGAAGARLRSTFTDSAGRFRFDAVAPGTYLAGIFHPRLDTLGIDVPPTRIDVPATGMTALALGVPSRTTVLRAICPAGAVHDSTTAISGYVRDAATREPRADASVALNWSELTVGSGGLARAYPGAVLRTGADGRFVACNAPPSVELTLRAAYGSDTSGLIMLAIEPRGLIARDLFVGPAHRVMPAGMRDSMLAESAPRAGDARLAGVVRSMTGAVVPGARVTVWGTPEEVTTGAEGQFSLAGLPAGTQTMDVRAIGFRPALVPVDLLVGDAAANRVAVTLERTPPMLDTARVLATFDYALARTGFAERRRMASGQFIDRATIERRNPIATTDLLSLVNGIRVWPLPQGHGVLMQNFIGEPCIPDLYIDKVVYSGGGMEIDQLTSPESIAGIEVYTRGPQMPLEFTPTTSGGCGAIVIWTRIPPSSKKEQP